MTPRSDRRPNPDELLRRVQAEERREQRGRLKIFLGYAPRVGKSLRMFDEGRRRKERGQDVVIAAAQNEVPGAVREIVSHLEIIPTVDGPSTCPPSSVAIPRSASSTNCRSIIHRAAATRNAGRMSRRFCTAASP